MHVNTDRIWKYINLLTFVYEVSNYDILPFTKTSLTDLHNDACFLIDGYNFYRLDRVGKGGGGIGVNMRDFFQVNVLCDSDPMYDITQESLILELTMVITNFFLLLFIEDVKEFSTLYLNSFTNMTVSLLRAISTETL